MNILLPTKKKISPPATQKISYIVELDILLVNLLVRN
jgi:hypothetical protein